MVLADVLVPHETIMVMWAGWYLSRLPCCPGLTVNTLALGGCGQTFISVIFKFIHGLNSSAPCEGACHGIALMINTQIGSRNGLRPSGNKLLPKPRSMWPYAVTKPQCSLCVILSVVSFEFEDRGSYWTNRQISNIRRTESQTVNVSCLVLQLSLSNPLKPGIKSIMKM